MLFLFNPIQFAEDMIRNIMLWLCQFIYESIITACKVFMYVGEARILDPDVFELIVKRVGLVLGIFMLFKLTFSLIQMMVDPDRITDKERGVGSLIKKVIIVIVLLSMTNTFFSEAYKLQHFINNQQIIGKIILGKKDINIDAFGAFFSYYLFSNFYHQNETSDESGECTEEFYTTGLKGSVYDTGMFELAKKCVNERDVDNEYVTKFDPLPAILVGGFGLWVLVMYVITLGLRVAKLAFLQLVAPIPILSYLSPKKETGLEKWIQQCVSTFLDLFIRTGIIYFALLLINELCNGGSIFGNSTSGITDSNVLMWANLVIILGILLFAKKAPDLLGEIFPSLGGKGGLDFGIGLKSRTDFAGKGLVKRAAGVASTVPVMAAQRGFQSFNRKQLNKDTGELENRKLHKRIGSAAAGVISGAARGVYYGGRDEKILGGIKQGIGAQNKSSAAINKWVESGGTSSVDRILTGVAKSVGLSTQYERIKAEIAGKDAEIKRHKVVADSGVNVNSAKDATVDFAKGKVTSRENKNALGDAGLNILSNATGLKAEELAEFGITANTGIGDAAYLTSASAERLKNQLKNMDNKKINRDHVIDKYTKNPDGSTKMILSSSQIDDLVVQEEKQFQKEKDALVTKIHKLENNTVINKKLSEYAVNQAIIGGKGVDIHPALADNIKNVLNNAEIASGIFASSTDKEVNKKAEVINSLISAIKNVQETHTFTPFPDPTGLSGKDENGNPKDITSAYDLLDKLATLCNNQANDEKRIVAKIEEEKRAKEAEARTIQSKANDEYNGK